MGDTPDKKESQEETAEEKYYKRIKVGRYEQAFSRDRCNI